MSRHIYGIKICIYVYILKLAPCLYQREKLCRNIFVSLKRGLQFSPCTDKCSLPLKIAANFALWPISPLMIKLKHSTTEKSPNFWVVHNANADVKMSRGFMLDAPTLYMYKNIVGNSAWGLMYYHVYGRGDVVDWNRIE